jgi:SAM-dependent methyltransferase
MDCELALACRCCGSTALCPVLNLGCQPLANSYLREPAELPRFPLELLVCESCCHNQLSVVVNPERMFRHYLYVSGTSRTLRAHFAEFAQEVLQWVGPRPRPHRVLDLACNDGTLLEAFAQEGCVVAGVDPAANLVTLARSKGLDVAEGYWPAARSAVEGYFDLVTAANVLAHVANPATFLAAALDCLTNDGMVVLEFPYCRELIARCEWDTIYHEHLSYFLVAPLLRLLDRVGASAAHIRLVPIHGGSLRVAVRPGAGGHCQEALALAEQERRDGFQNLATYHAFARRVDACCTELWRVVSSQVADGWQVVGYGASAKGNTLLNRCPLPLSYIVDDNPLKHGYLTPGQWIPIQPTATLAEETRPLCLVLLAWNFADEILANVRRLRPGRGDTAVGYIPAVSVVAL